MLSNNVGAAFSSDVDANEGIDPLDNLSEKQGWQGSQHLGHGNGHLLKKKKKGNSQRKFMESTR